MKVLKSYQFGFRPVAALATLVLATGALAPAARADRFQGRFLEVKGASVTISGVFFNRVVVRKSVGDVSTQGTENVSAERTFKLGTVTLPLNCIGDVETFYVCDLDHHSAEYRNLKARFCGALYGEVQWQTSSFPGFNPGQLSGQRPDSVYVQIDGRIPELGNSQFSDFLCTSKD